MLHNNQGGMEKEISFKEIGRCLNVHQFFIWEFIRRYGYEKGVHKDRFGFGHVPARLANRWIHKLAEYRSFQQYSYKQEINKGQYTYISEERRQREVESEQDLERVYGVDEDGSIVRGTVFASGGRQVWKWNDLFQSWQLVSD